VAKRKSVSTYHYKPNTENMRRTTISSAEGDVDEVATASVTCRKQKEPDAIKVERRQKRNKASCDTSEDNNTETEDEGVEDEGDARAQPKPQKPAKRAAASTTKPSAMTRKPRANKPSAKAKKPSRPAAKKIRSQGRSRVSATASKR
jgi:hypothetical protein